MVVAVRQYELQKPIVTSGPGYYSNLQNPSLPISSRPHTAISTNSVVGSNQRPKALYSAQFSVSDEYLAVCDAAGVVHLMKASTGEGMPHTLKPALGLENLPVMSFKWRPEMGFVSQKNVITVARTDGYIEQYHTVNGKSLNKIDCFPEKRKEEETTVPALYCLDYSFDASEFAVGGKDGDIFVFDERTHRKKNTLARNQSKVEIQGHKSRVTALQYLKVNSTGGSTSSGVSSLAAGSNLLVSGGWDSTIQIWDQRKGNRSVRSIYGPQLSGSSALDVRGNHLLTGSFRGTSQLQLWDLRQSAGKGNKCLLDFSNYGITGDDKDRTWKSSILSGAFCGGGGGNGELDCGLEEFTFSPRSRVSAATDISTNIITPTKKRSKSPSKKKSNNADGLKNGNLLSFPMIPPEIYLYSAQFSATGRYIAIAGSSSSGEKGMMRILNTMDLTYDSGGCHCAVFGNSARDNLLCAVGSDGMVRIVDL